MLAFISSAPPPPMSGSGCNVSQQFDTRIDIQWITPADCGGREDCFYLIKTGSGSPKRHSPSAFRPNSQEEFTIRNLQPDTTYQITVSIHNGVSDQDPENVGHRECTFVAATVPGSEYNSSIVRPYLIIVCSHRCVYARAIRLFRDHLLQQFSSSP